MPLSQTIEIVSQDGAGGTDTSRRTIPTTSFSLFLNETEYQPAVVTDIEIENSGNDNQVSDQCGNTERNRTGNSGWAIRVNGIITGEDARQGNLSLSLLRDVVASSDSVTIGADIQSGTFEVGNVVITQQSDLVSIETANTNGKEKAYEFQLQLGETQSQ
jgi:hypothetical protein